MQVGDIIELYDEEQIITFIDQEKKVVYTRLLAEEGNCFSINEKGEIELEEEE